MGSILSRLCYIFSFSTSQPELQSYFCQNSLWDSRNSLLIIDETQSPVRIPHFRSLRRIKLGLDCLNTFWTTVALVLQLCAIPLLAEEYTLDRIDLVKLAALLVSGLCERFLFIAVAPRLILYTRHLRVDISLQSETPYFNPSLLCAFFFSATLVQLTRTCLYTASDFIRHYFNRVYPSEDTASCPRSPGSSLDIPRQHRTIHIHWANNVSVASHHVQFLQIADFFLASDRLRYSKPLVQWVLYFSAVQSLCVYPCHC